MSWIKLLSPIMMMIVRSLWRMLFGKRDRALIPIEMGRVHIEANGVIFDLPRLKMIGLDEVNKVLTISDGRTVMEFFMDDISDFRFILRNDQEEGR